MATTAGWSTARRVFEDPSKTLREESHETQLARYNLLWSYYNNAMFDKSAVAWTNYRDHYQLYRNIRLIYNPVRRLVDFYAGVLYPGVLSEDGSKLPEGIPNAIPFAEDTPDTLKSATAQLWQWSNWQSKMYTKIRYGAALGDSFAEITDDVARRKVSIDIVWPGHVVDLDLDSAGNLVYYALEYQAEDDDGPYTYRKEVDKKQFRYFRDGQPYAYSGAGAVAPNIYGFVPAVWTPHRSTGTRHGSPAIAGSLTKLDELNALMSHIHDQIHKVIGAPIMISSSGNVTNLFGQPKRGRSDEYNDLKPSAEQENVLMIKAPSDAKVASLAGDLPLAESAQIADKQLAEIEQDHPELALYRELRAMSQITGPAASRLIGDVTSRVAEVAANSDASMISLFRMAVAIGGERANSGAWGALNRQQVKFTPFNLQSYERGKLDMAIMPRPLLIPTRLEKAQEQQAYWQGLATAKNAGVPVEILLERDGWTPQDLAQLNKARDEAQKRAQQAMLSDMPDEDDDDQNDDN